MNLYYDQHILQQPDAVEEILINRSVPALDANRPIVLVGIGTSWHAAQTAASWIRQLSGRAIDVTAFTANDYVLFEPPRADDQVIVISHRGTKRYPNAALRKANDAGGVTIAVTGKGDTSPEADCVIRTCEQEKSATHTVSYTSALAVLAKIVIETLGAAAKPLSDALPQVPELMRATIALGVPSATTAVMSAEPSTPGLIAGLGLGFTTASEAALKLKEGTYRWFEAMDVEFALHGTPAIFRSGMAACIINSPVGEERINGLYQILNHIGAKVLWCDSRPDADLPTVPHQPIVSPFIEIIPFQQLVAQMAKRVGSNPDLTHLETEPWKSAFDMVKL